MIILEILAPVGLLRWLPFALAVFALPTFVGVTAGAWARALHRTRAFCQIR